MPSRRMGQACVPHLVVHPTGTVTQLIGTVRNATGVVDDFQAIIRDDVDVAGFKAKFKVGG